MGKRRGFLGGNRKQNQDQKYIKGAKRDRSSKNAHILEEGETRLKIKQVKNSNTDKKRGQEGKKGARLARRRVEKELEEESGTRSAGGQHT